AHGYAVTAHRSQGKTMDAVVISADSMHRELFQVAATRGREHIQIVTGNKEALKKSTGISDKRQPITNIASRVSPPNTSRNSHRSLALTAAREEGLLASAHMLPNELENRNRAQNIGPIQQNNQGIEYGIHL